MKLKELEQKSLSRQVTCISPEQWATIINMLTIEGWVNLVSDADTFEQYPQIVLYGDAKVYECTYADGTGYPAINPDDFIADNSMPEDIYNSQVH